MARAQHLVHSCADGSDCQTAAPRNTQGESSREASPAEPGCWLCGDPCDCTATTSSGCGECRDFYAANMNRSDVPALDRDTFKALAALHELARIGGAR